MWEVSQTGEILYRYGNTYTYLVCNLIGAFDTRVIYHSALAVDTFQCEVKGQEVGASDVGLRIWFL